MTRLLIVLACLIFFGLCLLGMRAGWIHRAARQSSLPGLAPVPGDLGPPLLPPASGLYVGTTSAEHWQDRVVAQSLGLRADSTCTLSPQGLLVARAGAGPVFIPAGSIVGAGLGSGFAGKVMGAGGLLIVRWRAAPGSGVELDTGLRFDDKSTYPEWVASIDTIVARTALESS